MKITVGYTLAASRAFASLSARVDFVYMSGEAADMEEGSCLVFGRIRGRVEKTLLGLREKYLSLEIHNVCPATTNPRDTGKAQARHACQGLESTWWCLCRDVEEPWETEG